MPKFIRYTKMFIGEDGFPYNSGTERIVPDSELINEFQEFSDTLTGLRWYYVKSETQWD